MIFWYWQDLSLINSQQYVGWHRSYQTLLCYLLICMQSFEHRTASDSRLIDDLPDETKVREQFIKISGAKYITDGLVLTRVLLSADFVTFC